MANIKYCRTVSVSSSWYVFGFNFNDPMAPRYKRGIYCHLRGKLYKRTNRMYLIEASEDIKKLLFSENVSDRNVAISILNAELSKSDKQIIGV